MYCNSRKIKGIDSCGNNYNSSNLQLCPAISLVDSISLVLSLGNLHIHIHNSQLVSIQETTDCKRRATEDSSNRDN